MDNWLYANYVKELNKATIYISTLPKLSNKQRAIIFDIDDTLLIPEINKPIPETLFFYNWVKARGFKPVIVTARIGTLQNINLTIKQLKNLGIQDYEYIFFLPPESRDVANYKLLARKHISDLYDGEVVMSVGDNPWDVGDYGGYSVLLTKR
jgi:predicted secreted acid phosphatase